MKEARPTTGKVLQAVFNILGPIAERSFLDLFSGTGRIAREAIDRGARPVVAVEIVKKRCGEIKELLNCGSDAEHIVLCMNVRRSLKWLSKKGLTFNVIFADPPYDSGWGKDLLGLISSNETILAPEGIIIVEHSPDEIFMTENTSFIQLEQRKYGNTVLEIFEKRKKVTRPESESE